MREINIMILVLLLFLSNILLGQTSKDIYRLGKGKITLKKNGRYYFLKKVGTKASSSGKYYKNDSIVILFSKYDEYYLKYVKYKSSILNKDSDSITLVSYLKNMKDMPFWGVTHEVMYKDSSIICENQFGKRSTFPKRNAIRFKVYVFFAQSVYFDLKIKRKIPDKITFKIEQPHTPSTYYYFKNSEFIIKNDSLIPTFPVPLWF